MTIQGEASVIFLKSPSECPCRQQNSYSFLQRECTRNTAKSDTTKVTLAGKDRVHSKGAVLCERMCFCLLSTFQAPSMKRSLLRALLRTLSLLKAEQAPSKNPSKKHLPLKNLLRTLLRRVSLQDPLGVHPTKEPGIWSARVWGSKSGFVQHSLGPV